MSTKTSDGHQQLSSCLRFILLPHWRLASTIIGLILLASILEGVGFSLLVPLVQMFSSDSRGGQGTTSTVFDLYETLLASYQLKDRLAILGLAILGVFVFKNVVQYLREVLAIRLWLGISTENRMKAVRNLLHHPYCYFLERKQGALVQQLYYEPHTAAYFVQVAIEQCSNLLAVAVLVGLLFMVSWKITLLVLAVGSVYNLATWRFSKQAHAGGEERQQVEAESVAFLSEAIGGIRQVKVFSAEKRIEQVYEQLVNRFRAVHSDHWLSAALPNHVTELFWIGLIVLILSFPALGLVQDAQSVLPIVAVFSVVAFRVGPYISRISQGWLNLKFYLPALYMVAELIKQPKPQYMSNIPLRLFRNFSEVIRFENVGFSYGGDKLALGSVSLEFKRGEMTAVVGPSGAGKSTMADLLVRLYNPSRGRISVDGVDLRTYDPDSWLDAIGFVSQDAFIFHGTIRDNIAFSRPGATLNEVQAVAKQANAHEFIERAPQGYDTVVGDRGLKLSGGERQRIAIARALIRNPQILVFDEATSALDNQSEALIQEAIAGIVGGKTVILIAHRLSTVVRADKIVVLASGHVEEEGTHDMLLKNGGLYASLYTRGSV